MLFQYCKLFSVTPNIHYFFFFGCSEEIARESKIYTYRKSFNGFVARLLPHEVQSLSGIHNYKFLLSKLMILFPLILYITLALTCSWKDGCISFSKHSAQTSHNENMGLLRNVWNTESRKRSKRERYYCWPLGFRLVFLFFSCPFERDLLHNSDQRLQI